MKRPLANLALKISKIALPNNLGEVIIIDDALLNPEVIVEYARENAYFNPYGTDGTLYPGIRDNMPKPYIRVLHDILLSCLGIGESKQLDVFRSLLSVTTLKQEKLMTEQKMPHIDTIQEDEFACVHYFCAEHHGGTSIYRYKPANTIAITKHNVGLVDDIVQRVKASCEEHNGYLTGETSLFEPVVSVEAKFNRIVVYKGNLLHCANLQHSDSLLKDVEQGRLSVASFFAIEKK